MDKHLEDSMKSDLLFIIPKKGERKDPVEFVREMIEIAKFYKTLNDTANLATIPNRTQ